MGKHVTDLLVAYSDGRLDSRRASEVAAHLLACRKCREASESIRLTSGALRSLKPVPAPAGVLANIERAIESADDSVCKTAVGVAANDQSWPSAKVWVAVAVMDIVVFGVIAWLMISASPTAFQVTTLEGRPRVGQRVMDKGDMLATGEWLETDGSSRVRIAVADIGQVEIGPGSRVGLVATGPTEHRLSLERGSMRAVVSAPPRLFLVDTPTATAVDYGCVYTLVVGEDSRSTLRVSSGRVALEREGRDVMVPEGAMCEARKDGGVGTPVYEDATVALRDAVRRFDFEAGGAEALATILAEARPRDVITLEYIADRVSGAERQLVLGRRDQLVHR